MEREFKWQCTINKFLQIKTRVNLKNLKLIEMESTYYDTKDGFLKSNRYGLRLRKENGTPVCCLKKDEITSNGLSERLEFECRCSDINKALSIFVRDGADEQICNIASEKGVLGVCCVDFIRADFEIEDDSFSAHLSFDEGVYKKQHKELDFSQIELEFKDGVFDKFLEYADVLQNQFELIPIMYSKFYMAMSL